LAALLHGTLVVGVSQTAAFNRGRHLYLAGRPSGWALAHISSLYFTFNLKYTSGSCVCIDIRQRFVTVQLWYGVHDVTRTVSWCSVQAETIRQEMSPGVWLSAGHALSSCDRRLHGMPAWLCSASVYQAYVSICVFSLYHSVPAHSNDYLTAVCLQSIHLLFWLHDNSKGTRKKKKKKEEEERNRMKIYMVCPIT